MRLDGSLPKVMIEALRDAHALRMKELEQAYSNPVEREVAIREEKSIYSGKFNDLLDNDSTGPHWLKDRKIASLVRDSFVYWHEQGRFKLIVVTIMSNHVHAMLYKIQKPLYRILQSIKTHTATEANKILDRTGQTFWAHESYDNLVRDRDDLGVKLRYILNNPVQIGLVKHWSAWEWTWLNPEFEHYAR